MNTKVSILIGLALSLSTGANAADVEGNLFRQQAQPQLTPSQRDFAQYAGISIEIPQEVAARVAAHQRTKGTTSQAAASGISYFEIAGVGSAQYGGWEYPSAIQTTTSNDHGGNPLWIAVLQVGYGNPNNATMNGVSKSAFKTEYRCGSDLHVCNTGETILGFVYYYDFTGQNSGTFQASSNSVASPYGYWSDSIYIL